MTLNTFEHYQRALIMRRIRPSAEQKYKAATGIRVRFSHFILLEKAND